MHDSTKSVGPKTRPPVPRIQVEDVLAGSREAILMLGRDEYRLRLTSNQKLILTK